MQTVITSFGITNNGTNIMLIKNLYDNGINDWNIPNTPLYFKKTYLNYPPLYCPEDGTWFILNDQFCEYNNTFRSF